MTSAPETVEPRGADRLRSIQRLIADNPVAVLAFVFVALFIATDLVNRLQSGQAFLTPKQVSTTFLYAAILGLMAAGQTLVMLTGGVDLSVATTATTAAFMISSFATHGAAVAILVALAAGLGIGLVNGIGVAIFRVNPLIMTLGISTVTLGALTIYSQQRFLAPAPDLVVKLGSERFATYIPYGLLVWVPISALIILGLRYSGIGRLIYAVGDNPEACRLAGIRTWQVLLTVYALCGMLSAGAGILLVGFNDAADLGIAGAVPPPLGGRGRDRRHLDLRRDRRLRRHDRRSPDPHRPRLAAHDRQRLAGDSADPLRADHPRARGDLRPRVRDGLATAPTLWEDARKRREALVGSKQRQSLRQRSLQRSTELSELSAGYRLRARRHTP